MFFRIALLCAALMAFAPPSQAVERCRQSSLAGTWWSLWDFGTGESRCAMQCQLRFDKKGNVRPGGQCIMFRSGQTAVSLRTTGGRIKILPIKQSWYCDFRGDVEVEHLSFEVRSMMSHDWGPKGRPGTRKNGGLQATPSGRQWSGIVQTDDGAVGTVTNIWRGPTTGPLPHAP